MVNVCVSFFSHVGWTVDNFNVIGVCPHGVSGDLMVLVISHYIKLMFVKMFCVFSDALNSHFMEFSIVFVITDYVRVHFSVCYMLGE